MVNNISNLPPDGLLTDKKYLKIKNEYHKLHQDESRAWLASYKEIRESQEHASCKSSTINLKNVKSKPAFHGRN